MKQLSEHYIGGERSPIRSNETILVCDAATEAPLVEVRLGDTDDVAEAVAAARRALPAWHGIGATLRASYLRALADVLETSAAELAHDISREVGMPLKLSRRIQVDAPIAAWRATAALAESF